MRPPLSDEICDPLDISSNQNLNMSTNVEIDPLLLETEEIKTEDSGKFPMLAYQKSLVINDD